MVNKKVLFTLFIILGIMTASSVVSAGLFDSSASNDLNVSDITITSEGYSMYKVNCEVTPKKDFSYLEMQVIFYDSDDAVVGKSSLVWNVNDPEKDQLMKVSGTAMTDDASSRPARAEVYFVDSAFGSTKDDAIYVQNVTM
ncbi:hypothetical protein [Methanosphaera sp. BMS]|uniref:hypothetical protein n=1 Tax=Methanosphaera sp. BMS TaxID=1789762 RepID=UPI000DC1CDB1|nr:hypothetical protein [Methanosphaera sp. BMS]AWX31600.1 hypothetical protein AW729_00220 [Methanosphaera sp. BMS]